MKNYQRIVLKLSGEAFKQADDNFVINKDVLIDLANQINILKNQYNLQIGIVVGGGNIFRGKVSHELGLGDDTGHADYIGMLSTSINALVLNLFLNNLGITSKVQNAFKIENIVDKFNAKKAIQQLENNHVVILGGGTGKPYLSTDTAAAQFAKSIKAKVILMAKNNVDGVYDSDPLLNKTAKFLPNLSFEELIAKNLKVIDHEALEILKGTKIDILLFNMNKRNNIINLYRNEKTKKTIIKEQI